jgi:uncharacterized RDD family membrane protein YckC
MVAVAIVATYAPAVIEQPVPLPPPPPIPSIALAGFWIRVLARIIDVLVLAPLAIPMVVHVFEPLRDAFEQASRTGQPFQAPDVPPLAYGWAVLLVAGTYLYQLLMVGRWGATVGKFATGLRVRLPDGTPVGWREAALRPVLQSVTSLLRVGGIGLLGLIDYLWMLWDKRKQTLHDKLAGTIVVKG